MTELRVRQNAAQHERAIFRISVQRYENFLTFANFSDTFFTF